VSILETAVDVLSDDPDESGRKRDVAEFVLCGEVSEDLHPLLYGTERSVAPGVLGRVFVGHRLMMTLDLEIASRREGSV
jgi:hypothetical protein